MKNIIKKWLDDHRIRWKEDEYKIPEERIDLLITMLKSEPKECSCGIEYDENREQYITLCEKHKNDEEVRLRKEYENNKVSGGDKYPNSTGGSGGTTCGSRYSDNIYWSEPTYKEEAYQEPTNPRGEIEREMEKLEEAVKIIDKEVSFLAGELEPILKESKDEDGLCNEPQCSTKMGNRIQDRRMQLESVIKHIKSLRERIQI